MQSNICAFVSVICAYVYLPSQQQLGFLLVITCYL